MIYDIFPKKSFCAWFCVTKLYQHVANVLNVNFLSGYLYIKSSRHFLRFSLHLNSICDLFNFYNFTHFQIKLWMQETGHEIYYVGWVWEGNSEKMGDDDSDTTQPWLTWRPKVLAFRGSNLYYMEYPPV